MTAKSRLGGRQVPVLGLEQAGALGEEKTEWTPSSTFLLKVWSGSCLEV